MSKQTKQPQQYRQLAACAALVEGMYPNFALFCEAVGHEGESVYRHALNLVWEYASGRTESIGFERQLEKLEACIPNPDDYDIYGVQPALDACVGLTLLLQSVDSPQQDDFESLVNLSRGTLINYLEAIAYEGDDEAHPLSERFGCLLDEISIAMANEAADRRQWVDELKVLGCDGGLSNIGVSSR